MKKYVEFGIGNRWLLRTETEFDDGSESEQRGASLPQWIESLYLRMWIGRTVLIIDSSEGFKIVKKQRTSFKFLIGVAGNDLTRK